MKSLKKIVDGIGVITELEYDYLMPNPSNPSPQDFYSLGREFNNPNNHILTKGLPIIALKKASKKNVSNRPVSVNYQYKGLIYHYWGNGLLGFASTKETNEIVLRVNNADQTRVILKTEKHNNLTDYAPFVALAPSYTKTYDNNEFLLSETYFENSVYKNVCNTNMKVFFPVVTKQITNEYDVDNNTFLKKTITDCSYYNDGANNQYNSIVRPTATVKGITANNGTTSSSDCEYQTTEEVDYHANESEDWLINRPYHIKTRNVCGETAGIGSCIEYLYDQTTGCHHQIHSLTNVPNNGVNGPDYSDSLTTKTVFTYDGFGRIETETVSTPNDALPSKSTVYEYGGEYDYRLLTRTENALGYETLCSYDDDYDYCTSITDQNGLTTRYHQDPLGITKRTMFSDGTESCQALRWEGGLSQGYYVWTKTTGKSAVIEHKIMTGEVYKVKGKGFDGRDIITNYEYDQYGRLFSKSFPHYEDNNEPEKEIYHYDDYQRLVTIDYPDGAKKAIIYDGLVKTEKSISAENLEQSVTTEVNILGQTIQVTDADRNTVSYGYYPDGNLHWTKVNESDQVKNTMQYDHRGNRIRHEDPNYGVATSKYNAYGELISLKDPRGNRTSMAYDILGRMTLKETHNSSNQIVETTEWAYSEEEGEKGLLSSINYGNGQHVVDYSYDGLLRIKEVNEHIAGESGSFVTSYIYDEASRIKTTIYPTGVTLTNHFNPNGYLKKISESDNGTVWETEEIDEFGLLKRFSLGNGVSTEYNYDVQTKQLRGILTRRNGGFIQNLSYDYDGFYNLAVRTDSIRELEESFTYDVLNRLVGISLNGNPTGMMTYDGMGRMTGKSQNGRLVFATNQNSFDMTDKPHALRKAETGGNVFSTTNQFVTYTNFDKVQGITEGSNSLSYTYGYDRQRLKMTETVNGIQRKKLYVGQCEYITENNVGKTITFLGGPIGVFAVLEKENGISTLHYVHKDHLGSWTTITEREGRVEQELSFDAWGNLRNPETWSGSSSAQPMFDRGYTGHELLPAFNLINMNGRMYDPLMSSFLSVDAIVNDPTSAQGFNRYAYCMYNPLKYTDPSGWTMQGGMKPRNPFHDDWSASHVIPTHGASDFSNPYYLCNMAFYGNLDGPQCKVGGSGGGGFSMDELVGTYGYQVTYRSNSVYNYSFPSTQLQLIRNWQFNPCRNTNKDIRDAGITDLTVGVVNYGGGVSTSFYQWGCASGQSHSASVWYEPAGSDNKGCFSMSNQPLWMYNDCSNNAPPSKALKLNSSNCFIYDGHWKAEPMIHILQGGQIVKAVVTNNNVLGVTLRLQDVSTYYYDGWFNSIRYEGESYSFQLMPFCSTSRYFYHFGECPYTWKFELSTPVSDVVNVSIKFYSDWVPGMPPSRNDTIRLLPNNY